ncbi:MAG TPA: glycosyltransferase [Pseudoxanthomonas sp.]|nr:glycosyltransferase [Pseudoxanthomonas sp.]
MPSIAELRFGWAKARHLSRRLVASLRQEGPLATWQRILRQIRPVPHALRIRNDLYLPEPAPFARFAVPASDTPLASIVIPVYNQVSHTLTCLRAIAKHPPAAAIEIIVVDDGSSDDTSEWIPQIEGLHYLRRMRNGGFIAACNDGAAAAHGDFLVFLNNDTVPQPGWLDTLLATFEQHANVGLAGAQLLYPDGRLQEAGGVVFSDGSAWNYGRFESPYDPRFGYVRDADYCSGAAIAVPRTLFASIGGFDARYAPAYYEDTDLAFAVRAAGRRVLYQPAARVVHMEGATAGTDTSSGAKAYQVRNAAIFATRWKKALEPHSPPGTVPEPEILHRNQRQVLVVDALLPQPDRDSGSLRMFNLLRLLRREGAHVCFLALNPAYDEAYVHPLQELGVETWYAPYSGSMGNFLRMHGSRFDVVLLSRHYVAAPLLPLLRRYAPRAKLVFDTVDLHGLRELRAAELSNDPVLRQTALSNIKSELLVVAQTDTTLVVSPFEREWLLEKAVQARVEVLSNLHDLHGPGLPFSLRKDLVFVGSFLHPPNVDSMLWFTREIFPLVRARLADVRLHCIGSNCPPEILALASWPGVLVHGHVPDLAPYMEGMRIALAPLRFGAGVKGKINLSMAHGQPVVATTCAVEGMHLRDGHDVLVADSPADFADAVIRLYQDEALWNVLACNGMTNIAEHFTLDAARDTVRRVFFQP